MHRSKLVPEGRGWSVSEGQPPAGYRPDQALLGASAIRAGFSGTCEATLADWIQMVQMGRRDAVVNLRTPDGNEATLWCRGGDIIDAACDGLAGEDAVYRLLTWRRGRVTVDFADFTHPREIQMPTSALLVGAAFREDSALHELAQVKGPTGGADLSEAPVEATLITTVEFEEIEQLEQLEEIEQIEQIEEEELRRRRPMLLAVAGGVLALLVAAALVWKLKSPIPLAGTTAGAPVADLRLRVDVEPEYAAIVLDGKQVGAGKVDMSLPRDGRTHDILYFARGHVSQRVVFGDAPPPERVSLLRMEDQPTASEGPVTDVGPIPNLASAQADTAASGRPYRRAVKVQADRPTPAAPETDPPSRESAPAEAKVQIIEERPPRIQIIDERKPRIDVIK